MCARSKGESYVNGFPVENLVAWRYVDQPGTAKECGMLIRTMPNGNDSVCTLQRGHSGDHGYREIDE